MTKLVADLQKQSTNLLGVFAQRLNALPKSGIGLMATIPDGNEAELSIEVRGAELKERWLARKSRSEGSQVSECF